MRSLRLRLLAWLLVPLALYASVSVYQSWQTSASTALFVQDQNLLTSARIMADNIRWQDARLIAEVPPSALELFATVPLQAEDEHRADPVYYRVITTNGALLTGTPELPGPPGTLPTDPMHPVYYDAHYQGHALRLVALARTMYDESGSRQTVSIVGQTTHGRSQLQLTLWRPLARDMLAMLVLAGLLTAVGLTMELRPILRLRREVAAQAANVAHPLPLRELHDELRPVIEAFNQGVQRLDAQALIRKRFIAAAAHQLRTPLAVLDTQLQYLANQAGRPMDEATLKTLRANVRRMATLTDKLLLMAQAEAENPDALPRETVDLRALTRQVFEGVAALAQWRDIDLGLESARGPHWVRGNPVLAQAMLSNLVENALHYTPAGGHVTVTLVRDADGIGWRIADDGPGLSAEARERVFEPFYRLSERGNTPGSGLGLAIVKEVATRMRGRISLGPGLAGRGLAVSLRFPEAPAPDLAPGAVRGQAPHAP